jgi:hypothetical protein
MKQNTKSECLVAACCGRVAPNWESVLASAIAAGVEAALVANLGKARVILAAPPEYGLQGTKTEAPGSFEPGASLTCFSLLVI